MKINDKHVLEIGELVLRCKKVVENDWDLLSVVFDTGEGHIANSGFLYFGDKVRPVSVSIEKEPLLLDDKIFKLRDKIYRQCGEKFKQILIQMENVTHRIKVDFEFEDGGRWSIKPAKLRKIREELRPDFSEWHGERDLENQ